jgi:hypothetical protein
MNFGNILHLILILLVLVASFSLQHLNTLPHIYNLYRNYYRSRFIIVVLTFTHLFIHQFTFVEYIFIYWSFIIIQNSFDTHHITQHAN